MRKKVLVLCLTLAAAFGLCFPAGAALGAEKVTVTYRVPFFFDVTREIDKGSAPVEISITDVHGLFFASTDHRLITDNLEIEWFSDEERTQAYGFDEGVEENLTLYGKVTETKTYTMLNGYGWDVQNGRVYAGDPVDDYYITSNEYQSPDYTDPTDGSAVFSYPGIKYSVYGRGMDVTEPFDVTLDFKSVKTDSSNSCWFEFSLFPSLTLAQAGVQGPWANAGAAACMMFGIGGEGNLGVTQDFKANESVVVGYKTSTHTLFENAGSNLRKLLKNGNMTLALTVEIGETETLIKSGDTVIARSPAGRADFPQGVVYMSFAINGGAGVECEFDVSLAQKYGTINCNGDAHLNVDEVTVNGMAMIAEVTMDEGYRIAKIEAEGEACSWSKVQGREDAYAIGLKKWHTGDVEINITTEKIDGETPPPVPEKSGCKKNSSAAFLSMLAALGVLAGTRVLKLK